MSGDHADSKPRSVGPPILWALSILVGIVAGLGAVAFRTLIAFFHNLLFLGTLSTAYDANVHTPPSPWGPFVILVPVAGALGVVFLVENFAPEAKGHGVPEVMDAILQPQRNHTSGCISRQSVGLRLIYRKRRIHRPIIQIGSSFGSTIGQLLRLSTWERITLIAAGAGGGIAATFNTPVGGVLFALEILMHEVSARTLVPVVIATATATYVGQLAFGPHPSFYIPALETAYFHLTNPLVLLAYAVLGVITGMVSALFIRSIYGFEHFFEKHVKGGYYMQHVAGMLVVGLMMYAFMSRFGHYYVEGVGYGTIQDVLSGVPFPLYFLILLFGSKLLATSVTLGSGASGGVFSPALFLGATTGAAYGVALHRLFPALDISAAAFAVVGMGGVVGGATGAAMAAIVMIFEMTLDYTVIVPMTLTVAISYAVRKSLMSDSIYTRKLVLRGESVPETLRADLHLARRAASIMNSHVKVLLATTRLRDLASTANEACVITDESGTVAGAFTGESLAALEDAKSSATIEDVFLHNYVVVLPSDSLWNVISAMSSTNSAFALVASHKGDLSATEVRGMISRKDVMDTLARNMELFGV